MSLCIHYVLISRYILIVKNCLFSLNLIIFFLKSFKAKICKIALKMPMLQRWISDGNELFVFFYDTVACSDQIQTIISLPEMCERLKAKDDIKRISTANKYLRSTNQVSNLENLSHGGLLIFCTFLWSLFLDSSQKSMTSGSELKTWEYSMFNLVQCF